jgi:serine/threonine protein kinase
LLKTGKDLLSFNGLFIMAKADSARKPDSAKPDSGKLDEEKLVQGLVSRGLLTREEYLQFRQGLKIPSGGWSQETMLERLSEAGLLTDSQASRLGSEQQVPTTHQIPGYQLLEKLGQGSMGTVYKARQLSMNRLVAVKLLKPKYANNAEFLERFLREAHLAAKFSSNNIVQAIDVGSVGDVNYFVMEYVEGTTLKQELAKGKVFEEKQAIEIVLQIARALEHAHRKQLIHRDIKPANIILTADGTAKLADLGMARDTTDRALADAEKGMTIGTPFYIAPEQINSLGNVDSRADMYSLGATFYHMVTGRPPFPYPKINQVLQAHLTEDLTPPDHVNTKLSSGLGQVVEFMMAKKKKDRYPSPADLVLDLECLQRGERPKIAHQRVEAALLKDLAKGEEEDEEEDLDEEGHRATGERRRKKTDMVPAFWLYILGMILVFSLVMNLILVLK